MMEALESRTLFSYAVLSHPVATSPILKLTAPDLNAKAGDDVAIEPLEISGESIRIVSTTPSSSDPPP